MSTSQADARGHFGPYGGRFVPEVLMAPLEELEKAYAEARVDPAFQAELKDLMANYAGRQKSCTPTATASPTSPAKSSRSSISPEGDPACQFLHDCEAAE